MPRVTIDVDIPDGVTLDELRQRLRLPGGTRVFVNGNPASDAEKHETLCESDEVRFEPAVKVEGSQGTLIGV